VLLEPVEARLPLSLLLADPTDQLLHAVDVEPARSPLTVDPLLDHPAAPEDADVAGDGLVGQVEWLGEFANGRLAPGEPADDRPSGPVAESSEGGIQVNAEVGSSCHGADDICNEVVAQAFRCMKASATQSAASSRSKRSSPSGPRARARACQERRSKDDPAAAWAASRPASQERSPSL